MSNPSGEAATNPRAVLGGNNPPADPFEDVRQEIEDLFDEAKNFADGEPIASAEMADTITKLYDGLHDAGKRADAMRVTEKKPHDDAAGAVQAKFNPLVQAKKGKVDMGKAALGALLATWRAAEVAKREAEAKAAREAADAAKAEAEALIRGTSGTGDLTARMEAEEALAHAKDVEKAAKRADRAATTGTGLRTVWVADLVDAELGLDWAYGRDPARFTELVQGMANEAVRAGTRAVPGFVVRNEKRAA